VLAPFVFTSSEPQEGSTLAGVAANGFGLSADIESQEGSAPTCSPCRYAVTLGTIYDFSLEATVDAGADSFDSTPESGGTASATLGFQFYEANGTTPVSAEVIPEPGTLSLVGCALLAGLLRRSRRRENP
jgi:hypothetical protein